MTTLFWTFYTDDNYKQAADRLLRSCTRFKLTARADEAPDQGTWRKNCNQKPRLLLDIWKAHDGPVVCMDADCVVHRYPILLTQKHQCDAILWNAGVPSRRGRYVSSGVTWWNKTEMAQRMLERWAELSLQRLNKIVDPLLRIVCTEMAEHATIMRLPAAYMKPYWIRKGEIRDPKDIVISCNERPGTHEDGAYARRKRTRVDPLTPEHALA